MPSKKMTDNQIERFVRSMEEQGVGVTRTTKGLLLRLPDGETTTLHFTLSDVRAPMNLMARLRRAGVRHPDDPKDVRELPSNITDAGPVADRSKQKVREAVEQLGWPSIITVQQIVNLTGMVHITATKAVYQMGFIPVKGKRGARDWTVPQEILDEKPVEPEESPTFEKDEELEAVLTVAPEEREFIDTHDSWVLNLDTLVNYGFTKKPITVEQLRHVLASAGLEMEVRVWRA